MNTPRKDIVYLMDTITDSCHKWMCELYIAPDGTKPSSHNMEQGIATIAELREQCQTFLDITGPSELTYITTHTNE